ncbi:hypothetical protein AB0M02_39515 [Actinoplanes sp. NPDC051861]|uniref:hypothetical protein n=1 Tax=Actinoplanes sp. NPDC051861 TaxID=3155170 RepID=UPI0034317DA8
MRRTTTAAVALCTLLGLFGCASTSEPAAPGAAPTAQATTPGLDEGTQTTCDLARQATLGENGHDLNVATGKAIVAAGKTSQSVLITSAANVLESAVLRAEAAAGTNEEAGVLAEVGPAILKVQTVCNNVDSLKSSISSPGAGGGAELGATAKATTTSRA